MSLEKSLNADLKKMHQIKNWESFLEYSYQSHRSVPFLTLNMLNFFCNVLNPHSLTAAKNFRVFYSI